MVPDSSSDPFSCCCSYCCSAVQPYGNTLEQQQLDAQIPHEEAIVNEDEVETQDDDQVKSQQEVALRRSTRQKRSAIPDDYIVYALEHESDLSIDNYPVSFNQAIQDNNSP